MATALGPRYRRLWTAVSVSNLADGIYQVALPLVAVQLTRSPALVAGVTLAAYLPWLLFALPAGALADRLDRRRIMVNASTVRVAAMLAMGAAALLGVLSLPLLYGVALLCGVAEVAFDTTSQSIMPMVVERDDLGRANGRLYAAQLLANEFAGRPVGGALVGLAVTAAFLAPAALYAVAFLALVLLGGAYRPHRSGRARLWTDVAEGVRYLAGHPLLRTLAFMVGVMNLASTATFSVFVLYAVGPTSPMGLTEWQYGVLLATLALGGLVGSLLVSRAERLLGRGPLLLVTVVSSAATLLVPALTADVWAVGAGFALGGAGIMMWNIVTVSLRQRIAPGRLLGRVNAGYRLLAWGTMPLGAALGGGLGEVLGVRTVFAVGGLVSLSLVLASRRVTSAAIAAAEAEGDALSDG